MEPRGHRPPATPQRQARSGLPAGGSSGTLGVLWVRPPVRGRRAVYFSETRPCPLETGPTGRVGCPSGGAGSAVSLWPRPSTPTAPPHRGGKCGSQADSAALRGRGRATGAQPETAISVGHPECPRQEWWPPQPQALPLPESLHAPSIPLVSSCSAVLLQEEVLPRYALRPSLPSLSTSRRSEQVRITDFGVRQA